MPNRPQINVPPNAPPVASADRFVSSSDSVSPISGMDASNREDGNDSNVAVAGVPNEGLDQVVLEDEESEDRGPVEPYVTWRWGTTPAALASVIVHTLLLLVLALLTMAPRVGIPNSNSFEFATSEGNAENEELLQTVEILNSGDSMAAPADIGSETPNVSPPSEDVLRRTLSEFQNIDPSTTTTTKEMVQPRLVEALSPSSSNLLAWQVLAATGVEGRSAENRLRSAKARGGTLESELAVERALDWLAAHQLPSGGWSLVHDGGKCNGQCKNNGSDSRYEPAATGLALLAFLGAGYTHQSGKHQRTVRDGVYYLLQIMEEANNEGSFLHQSERGMYNHGIAAFALCEAYQLSGDKDLKNPAQLAVNFICSAQNYSGGWGYSPKAPGDLTISGWQMMALKSAHAAELEVPTSVIVRIDHFLDTKQLPSGVYYGYSKPERDPTCSAIGVLLRLFRNWSHTDPRALELAQFLVKNGRSNGDVYYNYYATLLLFHLGGPSWEVWNPRIREHLIKTQNQSGHEAGSWFFEDQYAKEGGRLYTTAMCAMTLEVYYRFAPLYQQADRPFEL